MLPAFRMEDIASKTLDAADLINGLQTTLVTSNAFESCFKFTFYMLW